MSLGNDAAGEQFPRIRPVVAACRPTVQKHVGACVPVTGECPERHGMHGMQEQPRHTHIGCIRMPGP